MSKSTAKVLFFISLVFTGLLVVTAIGAAYGGIFVGDGDTEDRLFSVAYLNFFLAMFSGIAVAGFNDAAK